GIDLDHDNMPVILRAHGVSALPARQLITQLRMNRSLKGEYHKAVINFKTQEKDTPYGPTYAIRPKLIRLISDEVEVEELRVESQRLLGVPIPLPEGRPEELEQEPLGFTPKGMPFFSEEERDELLIQEEEKPLVEEKTSAETVAMKEPPAGEALTEEKVEETLEKPPAGEALTKETKEPKLDMDF
ncbi:unnamed protein product, partial [marine sediment metagenome]